MDRIAGHISWLGAPSLHWIEARSCTERPALRDSAAMSGHSFVDAERGLLITADTRLDNRRGLWMKLRRATDPASPPSDLRLVHRAYLKWGPLLGKHILGDYAIAIWDASEQHLVLLRDIVGIRPLYYASVRDGLVFASTVPDMLAHPRVEAGVNETAVAHFLAHASTGGPHTFFKGIRTVPPAHAFVFNAEGHVSHRYWQVDEHASHPPDDDVAYADGLRTVLEAAVRDRMAPGTTGLAVSGGLDSSSLACLAHPHQPAGRPLPIFSATFPTLPAADRKRSDERHYLRHLTQTGHFDVHMLPVDRLNPAEEIDDAVRLLGAPPHICNLYLQRHLQRAARAAGCTVMIDGSEGDVAVSHGLGWLAELAATRRWSRFIDEAQALAQRVGGAQAPALFWTFGAPYLHEQIQTHPVAGLRTAHQLHRALGLSRRMLWTRCVRSADAAPPPSVLQNSWINQLARPADSPLPRTERDVHVQSIHADDVAVSAVLTEINHIAAADGLERRHPFYDRRVLEYCVALPPTQKLRHGWTRWVLRTAMGADLPAAIRWRAGKSNLAPAFNRNLLRDAADRLDAAPAHPQLSNYLDPDAFAEARASGDAATCWRVLGLMAWFDALPNLAASSSHVSAASSRQEQYPAADTRSYTQPLPIQ